MAKIKRNEPCPCRSGLKYKKCCLLQKKDTEVATPEQLRLSLMAEIERIQSAAKRHEEIVRELGVFIFCTTKAGDAWLLEITESDAVQLSDGGEPLEVPIDENPETIEINWSHNFELRDRQFYLIAYADKQESCLSDMPVKRINAAQRRIMKKYSDEQLSQVHLQQSEA